MKNILRLTLVVFAISLAFTACKKATGEKAVTGKAQEAKSVNADAAVYKINTAASKIHWAGSKPGGGHLGTINISEGAVKLNGSQLVGGELGIDMTSITVTDLKPGEGKEDLEAHLKGMAAGKEDHFFNVAKYPHAKFQITSVTPSTTGGDTNMTITGNLSIKDQTRSVTFKAMGGLVGDTFKAAAPDFKINRTEWGINHMSKTIFDNLKDKFIDDEISLTIELEATKA